MALQQPVIANAATQRGGDRATEKFCVTRCRSLVVFRSRFLVTQEPSTADGYCIAFHACPQYYGLACSIRRRLITVWTIRRHISTHPVRTSEITLNSDVFIRLSVRLVRVLYRNEYTRTCYAVHVHMSVIQLYFSSFYSQLNSQFNEKRPHRTHRAKWSLTYAHNKTKKR